MDGYTNKNNNNGLTITNKLGDQGLLAGHALQLLGSSHLRPLSPPSSPSRTSSDDFRLLPPLGGTFPLPFLSGMMHPPSLNVLGSSIPLLSSLPSSSSDAPNPRRFNQLQQQQPNRFDAKAELYEIIRERARVQALAEAAQLFNNPAALAVALGGSGGNASQSDISFPNMLENIRALINNSSCNASASASTNLAVCSGPSHAQAKPPVVAVEVSTAQHQKPVVKKNRSSIGCGPVVLPLKDQERKATFPLPHSSSSSRLAASAAPGAAAPITQSLTETWKQLEQRATDPNKPPIPLPDVFVREFFARSLHGANSRERSLLKRRLEEKVQGILRRHHQRDEDATTMTSLASNSIRNDGETTPSRLARLPSIASEDGSSSEPLKKRIKRNYAAAVTNQAAV